MRVAFCHPDLGLGGAERLVVDAAVALQSKGHDVVIYTGFHDPGRAFPETTDGRIRVVVRGSWVPRSVCGLGHVACASLRNVVTAAFLARAEIARRDDVVVFADQISTSVPVFRAFGLATVFYVHFPDKLLASRASFLRRAYRWPFDRLEEVTTACAHVLLVNSKFTAGVFKEAFPRLRARAVSVLYPSVDAAPTSAGKEERRVGSAAPEEEVVVYAVSLNRYERKKRIDLAIKALKEVRHATCRLIIAGGYDARLAENVEHLAELRALAAELGIEARVSFETSISDERREELLRHAACLLYTPPHEHFGIVPLEAMARGCPVVACNSGGPLETVKDGETGFLVDATPRAFATAWDRVLDTYYNGSSRDDREGEQDRFGFSTQLGANARAHVRAHFSRDVFADRLDAVCTRLLDHHARKRRMREEAAASSRPPLSKGAWAVVVFGAIAGFVLGALLVLMVVGRENDDEAGEKVDYIDLLDDDDDDDDDVY